MSVARLSILCPATEMKSPAPAAGPRMSCGLERSIPAVRSNLSARPAAERSPWSTMAPWPSFFPQKPGSFSSSTSTTRVDVLAHEGADECATMEEIFPARCAARCTMSRRASFRPICRSSSSARTVVPRSSTRMLSLGRSRITSRRSESICPGLRFEPGPAPARQPRRSLQIRVSRQYRYAGRLERSHGSGRWISNGHGTAEDTLLPLFRQASRLLSFNPRYSLSRCGARHRRRQVLGTSDVCNFECQRRAHGSLRQRFYVRLSWQRIHRRSGD